MKKPTLIKERQADVAGRGQLRGLTYQFTDGVEYQYDLFDVRKTMQGSAGVVAVNEQGEVYLVREFLPALGDFGLSIPRGGIEPSETPMQAAQRELLEEAGVHCATLDLLWGGIVLPNTASWQVHLYLGQGISTLTQQGGDEIGGIELVKMPLVAACAAVLKGEIHGALTGFALLLAKQRLAL